MDRGIYAIVSEAIAQERRMDVVTDNLANIQTVGYKREKAFFKTLLAKKLALTPEKADTVFTHMTGKFTDWKEGSLRPTGNPLDMALDGAGFFAVETNGRREYTRSGNFVLNDQRQLVTRDGALVMGRSGPVRIPVGKLVVNERGEVSVAGAVVGTLEVVRFKDLSSAARVGERYVTQGEVVPAPATKVVQEALEDSNVNAIEEFAALVEINRNYEAVQKVVQAMDEAEGQAVSEIGRPV